MEKTSGVWLCPRCEGTEGSCRLCDGIGFITDMEMHAYESMTRGNTGKVAQNNSPGVLTLDLSEFEQE